MPSVFSAVVKRLQDVTCAGLEPLVGSKELRAACLLASTALPDSQDVLRFLLPRVGVRGSWVLQGSIYW